MSLEADHQDHGIAIIGMAARFPGARDVDAFWNNLVDGVDSISHFSNEELEPSFYESAAVRAGSNYVRARGIIEDVDKFDAGFFRFPPRDAAGMDPQHRVFMEVAWSALEHAGCNPATYPGAIGVWAGTDPSSYLWENILPNRPLVDETGVFPVVLNNDKDYVATRVSYKFDLRGPSITLQTACSTGLVVVHNAFHGLLSYQCDVALAGVSSILIPQKRGYVYQEGAIGSRDGRCRPFDAEASGTVFSDGVGVVVLKRLADAIADGDTIYAVIKGSALNNDGARKAGFTAPSVDGQAEAIMMAQALADIPPDTISYLEAHGTATPLGDPIEIAALTKAFRAGTDKTGFCAIGSVKGNIGHLDSAAGIAGLIKAALALHHKKIPASLHYSAPNPQIDFAASPFFVNAKLTDWPQGPTPRRAGVSSFGIGGTNAHVVLEEAPPAKPTASSRDEQLLVLSAKTSEALAESADQLARYLKANPDVPLHDVAHTLQEGRQAFPHRLAVVARTAAEAAEALRDRSSARTITGVTQDKDTPVAFMFPGVGSQYLGMAAELYRTEPVFRTEFDACADAFLPHIGLDIRTLVYPAVADQAARELLSTITYAQSATFAVELALARLLMSWGIRPSAMISHSVGEFAVACLAGVFSLDDLAMIAGGAKRMPTEPRGVMRAVLLGAAELEPMLGDEVWIAAYNAPQLTVVSGTEAAIAAFEDRLKSAGVWCKPVDASHAFHSPLMATAIAPLAEALEQVRYGKPQFKWISSLTGDWISDEQVMSVSYWTQQMCAAVRFSGGVQRLLRTEGQLLLEVGPGGALTTLVRQHREHHGNQRVLLSIGNIVGRDLRSVLEAVAHLWVRGVPTDWEALRSREPRRHVPLPTYPFARKRHWIDPPKLDAEPARLHGSGDGAGAEANDVLARVLTLLSSVSGIAQSEISPSASFLELGLDSLLLTQLVGAIARQFDVEITLPQLLSDYGTADKLARRLSDVAPAPVQSEIEVAPRPLIVARDRAGDIPLSFAQRRLWFMDRLEGPNAIYVIPLAVRLRGRLDRAALKAAFGDVVARHESLRTIYPEAAGLPRQEILASFAPELTEETVAEPDLAEAMATECRRGFNLASEPPVRIHLLTLAPDDTVLLLQVHHIAGDGFSLMALAKDLSEAYRSRVNGRAPDLPPLPVQYADFAAYQLELLGKTDDASSAVSRQIAYWTEALKGLPEEITLPKDRQRPPVATYRGDRIAIRVDIGLHQRLIALATETQASVFMVLQAALAALLTRLGAGTDIPIGSPIAGRTDKSLTDLVGCFVNMLVLRTDTSGDPAFRDLIARIRASNLGAYANQDLPFERLVEELNPARSLARHPLFQVMLAFLNTTRIEFKMPGAASALEPVNTRTAQYDLSFYLNERRAADGTPQGIEGVLEYSTDLFDAATARRMADGLLRMLDAATSAPDTAISTLALITPEERETLLHRWNDTASPIPDGGLPALVERQADRAPERACVIFAEARLSYAQLDAEANRIAQTLRARGLGRGHRVGLCLERDLSLLPALLGILKAGASYIPLDPGFPTERLRYMAENAELDALVSTAELAGAFGIERSRQLLLDADRELIASAPAGRLDPDDRAARPEDPAYILYTSGSTGKPKGVVVPHRAVLNFLASMAREPGFREGETLLAVTTLSFDIAVLELYLPLIAGGTVVIASREDAVDADALRSLLDANDVTVMQATPVTWRLLLESDWRIAGPFKALVGGEALPKPLADELIGRGIELWNMYGPTETTVWSTCAHIHETSGGITIGKPIANTAVLILDETGQLTPIGVPGELCIGGDGVAIGYWKLPELTAERFITNPYASAPGARLYRTGDRARWRADGTLEHMGRLDDQVKVRGYRIELGEIETVLSEHPDVRQAAVRLHQAGPDDVRILAYFVPAKPGLTATGGLRKHMRSRLPDYMIPQSFLPIDRIPLTPNGKVDRRQLPLPAATESRPHVPETLTDPVEIAIAEIWTTLIAPSRPIGRSDRFFEMGGHSLLALQALRQMESKMGVRLDLRTLFQETLGEIAGRRAGPVNGSGAETAAVANPSSTTLSAFLRFLRPSADEPRA